MKNLVPLTHVETRVDHASLSRGKNLPRDILGVAMFRTQPAQRYNMAQEYIDLSFRRFGVYLIWANSKSHRDPQQG